jgi:ribose 1,5-bisphosphokinase
MSSKRGSPEPGRLFLVVGPSGAGKDSLIDIARETLPSDKVVFPARVITRPADAGGESHIAVDEVTFDGMLDAGAFALAWRAHDLRYGIPASIRDDLAAGRCVVINVSRGVLDAARASFPGLTVLSVTAAPDVLWARLKGRGREDSEMLKRRLARADAFRPQGVDVVEIDNSGNLEDAARAFCAAIARADSGQGA